VIVSIIAGVIIFGGIVYFLVRKSKPKKAKKAKKNEVLEDTAKVSRRSKDILQTLSERERSITEYLMEHGEVYQNKVSHELHIPKTSLVRILSSLEGKKVIEIEKIGKTKKIRLNSWFLGKKDSKIDSK
jgi:uncharacterized membrane protein